MSLAKAVSYLGPPPAVPLIREFGVRNMNRETDVNKTDCYSILSLACSNKIFYIALAVFGVCALNCNTLNLLLISMFIVFLSIYVIIVWCIVRLWTLLCPSTFRCDAL